MQSWLEEDSRIEWESLKAQLAPSVDRTCQISRQRAQDWLTLPTHQDARRLTLAETLAADDPRLTAMHQPENQIPATCFRRVGKYPGHRAGYLHNLWHRLTGTSGNN